MRGVVALGVLCAVLLGGCYGSTEPATNIRPDSAQLNARGTANNGPAYTFFQYQEFWRPPNPNSTPTRQWPAGASGSFSEKLTGLKQATDYYYTLCGADTGKEPVCANPRTFATPGPDGEDSVLGGFRLRQSADPSGGGVSAHSDPSGANPRGYLTITRVLDQVHVFKGFVSCLSVEGTQATVGAVGLDQDEAGNDQPFTAKFSVSDRGPSDGYAVELEPGSAPPDCSDGLPPTNGALITALVVTDH